MEWKPIETAPKDGTHILAYCPIDDTLIYVITWVPSDTNVGEGDWTEAGGEHWEPFRPTHWMPLPEPPK